jgi:hypothetical protein
MIIAMTPSSITTYYVVDAFTSEPFAGNAAGVMVCGGARRATPVWARWRAQTTLRRGPLCSRSRPR